MAKIIHYDQKAREALKRGIDKVANAVRVTLGPRGRNVAVAKSYGGPMITNDGVTIAKEIELKEPFENMGAEIVKEVAGKTNDVAGDGTTTAAVLTQAIIAEGMRHTSIMGVNAMGLRLGIEKAAEEAVNELRKLAKPIKDKDEIRQVATISAESEEIGKIIAETIEKVGKDGVVTVEESQTLGVDSEVVEGLEFDKGYVSPYMVTDAERMEAVYENAPIFITDKKVSSVKDILPLLEKLAQSGTKELVVIADDVDGEALTTFVLNKLRGGFSVLAVKAPGFGDRKKEMLADIAVTVGGQVVSDDIGIKMENAELAMLGKARKVIATKDTTIVVGGKGNKAEIEKRVKQLRSQLAGTDSKFDKEKIEERIAKLSGGVAVIHVGAATETEMKYLKLKIEDAVNATKAAIEEGVVPGGGSALVKVAGMLSEKDAAVGSAETALGFQIIIDALERPLKQIAANVGKGDGSVIVEKVKEGGKTSGYDALKDELVTDMLKAGIIDPVKVTRSAVQNAASAAAMLLTTEVAIAEEPKKEEPPMPHPDMGMM
ncbi:chaperonin GroEL [Candidatus Wolfebacteria bacterium]|nr:chaperonin GroEL [Candidatus Wolfebacteria bacterium]